MVAGQSFKLGPLQLSCFDVDLHFATPPQASASTDAESVVVATTLTNISVPTVRVELKPARPNQSANQDRS